VGQDGPESYTKEGGVNLKAVLIGLTAVMQIQGASAGETTSERAERIAGLVKAVLLENVPGADIRLPSLEKLAGTPAIDGFAEITSARLIEDRPNGSALVELSGTDRENRRKSEKIQTPYQAWKSVPIAIKRIYPNTRLKNEDFRTGEINVASGPAREYRGVLLPGGTEFSGMESRQTILENQIAVSTAIQKQPDLRKGDTVKLLLLSGDLELSTQAVAEEPASVGERIRVLTVKGKRELIGKVASDRSVEVSL
jgi:flagella basal body P-ring formation protein FlgA